MFKNQIGIKIGILGGGQLARMLCQAGSDMGYEMHVLSEQPDDPAAQVVRHWHRGKLTDQSAINTFMGCVDIVTAESEFIDTQLIQNIQSSLERKSIKPSCDHLALFSDRATQKKWLVDAGLPTAHFIVPESEAHLRDFFQSHKKGIVIKKRRFGYDGYGTFIIRNEKDFLSWLKKNNDENNYENFIAESFLPFRRELAVQIAQNAKKQQLTYPVVEWRAQDSKCLWVMGPIKDNRVSPVVKKIEAAIKKLGYIGLLAFEFFDCRDGIFINEVAPRVHNSGHHSIESCSISQFQAHLLAIAGEMLPRNVELRSSGFAMLNLLGSSSQNAVLSGATLTQKNSATLHWYGKKENRQGRKMGHLTRLSQKPEKALREVLQLKKLFKI